MTPLAVGKPIEWSPPSMTGNTPWETMCSMPLVIWSKAFSMLAGVMKVTRAGTVRGAGVERHAHDGRLVLADEVDVLQVRRLEEGLDAGEVRGLASLERRGEFLVLDGVGRRQAEPGARA
jgi:hypothetical protein